MKIKKIGHCCLLITLEEMVILTDPGVFSEGQNSLTGIDLILITHEHRDHLHAESVKNILENNPNAKIVCNSSVGKILSAEGVSCEILEGESTEKFKEVLIEAFDFKHSEIFEDYGQVQNTGYFIDGRLFYPGDSFNDPKRPIEVLAVGVVGPWCKTSDVIRYVLDTKPRKVIPVHDALLNSESIGIFHRPLNEFLPKNGIEFIPMKNGDEVDFV